MSVSILYSDVFLKHDPPHGYPHPENSRRIRIALSSLVDRGLDVYVQTVRSINQKFYLYRDRVHDRGYVLYIERLSEAGETLFIDGDTYVNKFTFEVATWAVGCAVYATDIALDRKEVMVFALVRPPGHHVGVAGRAMGAPTQGFCIFNNVAAAAMYAIDRKFKPVVILDIDVHHGNGTQEIFWTNPDVVHIDTHELGLYPGTGGIEDLGGGEGYGTKINITLYPFSRDDDFIYLIKRLVEQIVLEVKPKIILISAGFDAYTDDGLASMELTDRFYAYLGSWLRSISRELGVGIAAVLEGGYSVGLEKGLPAFLNGFANPVDLEAIDKAIEPSSKTKNIAEKLHEILRNFYKLG